MSKRSYSEKTLEEKLLAIADVESGRTYHAVAEKYGVSIGTVAGWVQQKSELKEKTLRNESCSSKRAVRISGDSAILDERVFTWFSAARGRKIPISGVLVQEIAKKVANNLNLPDFKASNGWLEAFRKRHFISFRALSGESAELDKEIVENWRLVLNYITMGYAPCDVWNLDETGLFWRGLPNRSLLLNSEKAHGGKQSKERVTICFLCSSTGEKYKPLLIGKSANPRAFCGLQPKDVIWKNNSKAWMNSTIFAAYLADFNSKLVQQKRKVLLFLDNAPCHPKIELSNIKFIFFPANTTSGTQPLDAGIIKNFKLKYRTKLINHMLIKTTQEGVEFMLKQINIGHAVKWIEESWKEINESVIKNCFEHVGFYQNAENQVVEFREEENYLQQSVQVLKIGEIIFKENLCTTETFDNDDWEEKIVNPLNEDIEPEDIEEISTENVPDLKEALKCLSTITTYVNKRQVQGANWHITQLEKIFAKKRLESLKDVTLDKCLKK